MPLEIHDRGFDNAIEIEQAVVQSLSGRVTLGGSRNRVAVAGPFAGHSLHVEMGDDCRLEIAGGCTVGLLGVHMRSGGSVTIGEASSFNGQTRLLLHEAGRIEIGAGCLFGPDVDITVSDMHSIVDIATGERLNGPRDVVISDRVWLGIGVFVGKGSRVGSGSVVGARSFVSGTVPPNSLVAGSPPRLLRSGITWRFELQ